MILDFKLTKIESTIVGKIRITFGLQSDEVQALRFLLDPSPNSFIEFKTLWRLIGEYEKASFGLKELMPSIVNKLQSDHYFQRLHSVLKGDFLVLSGLPKYTWTKNWYARNRLREISQALEPHQIQFMVIKGLAETLLNPQALNSRTCRDIDLLIHREQLLNFTELVAPLGWTCPELTNEILTNPNSYAGNSLTFRHPDNIIDLDLHFSNASFGWNSHPIFIKSIWNNAVQINPTEPYKIPNKQSRLFLSVWNLFDTDNLKSHQILKYLYDLMRELKGLSMREKFTLINAAQLQLAAGKEMNRLIILDAHLNRSWWQLFLYGLYYVIYWTRMQIPAIKISEKSYYWLYHTKINVLNKHLKPISGLQIFWKTFQCSRIYEVIYWKLVSFRDQSRATYFSYQSIINTKKDHSISYLKKSLWELQSLAHQRKIKKVVTYPTQIVFTITTTVGKLLLSLCQCIWQQGKTMIVKIIDSKNWVWVLLKQLKLKPNSHNSINSQQRPTLAYYLSINYLHPLRK